MNISYDGFPYYTLEKGLQGFKPIFVVPIKIKIYHEQKNTPYRHQFRCNSYERT
jgi:hypothetical protein